MDNPWFILILVIPAYALLSLVALSVARLRKKPLPVLRYLAYSFLGFVGANLSFIAALLLLSLTPLAEKAPMEFIFAPSLSLFCLTGLFLSYRSAMQKKPNQSSEPTRGTGP